MIDSGRQGKAWVWVVRLAALVALVIVYHGAARLGETLAAHAGGIPALAASFVVATLAAGVVAVLATERRWRTARLTETSAALRQLWTNTTDVVAEIDPEGRIRALNRAFSGLDRDELLGRTIVSVVDEADRPALHDALARAVATGGSVTVEASVSVYAAPARRLSLIVAPCHPGSRSLLVTASDRTELARARAELGLALARFDALCSVAPAGVFRTTARGDCNFVSDSWSEVTGLSSTETMGRGWTSLADGDPAALLGQWEAAAARHEAHESRHRVKSASGDVRWLLCRALPVCDEAGAVSDYLGCFIDISAQERGEARLRQAQEEAQQVARVNGEFLARASREVRTSLNSVMGMSSLLRSTDLTPEQREYVDLVQASGENLFATLTSLMEFSRIDAGSVELKNEVFNVRNEVENIAATFAEQAHAKKLELMCALAPTIPYEVAGDVEKLRQALASLLTNAVSFTERGRVILRVTPERTVADYAFLRFEVEDTGPGIAEEDLTRVFQPFAAIGPPGRRLPGSGLGLAIARRLVRLLGGDLQVRSRPGEGTTFTFSIKVEVTRLRSEGSAVAGTSLEGRRVLVVDDDPVARGILCSLLEGWGVEVGDAESGEAALQRIRGELCVGTQIDLVITDFMMAPIDGLELGRAIQADAALRDIKLVLMTSGPELAGRQADVRRAGFAASVRKPIRTPELLKCLVEVLSRDGEAFAEIPRESAAAEAGTRTGVTSARILLAEDNDINQRFLKRLLTRRGHHVEVVADGVQAIAAASSRHYDLVLMDCQMPQVDGWEATREIRRREAGSLRHVPIVAVTANALQGDRERCLDAGMDDYIAKPIRPESLDGVLERWLSEQPAAHEGV